ncbi:hypothetical protein BDW59DRAFT_151585 [Aspergillus cavernicola]|uniref:Uncharacterized protein n=1 Tax=Aspergillus cavernicola TaxID=176166 RepID=A0ABR4HV91_9EURO
MSSRGVADNSNPETGRARKAANRESWFVEAGKKVMPWKQRRRTERRSTSNEQSSGQQETRPDPSNETRMPSSSSTKEGNSPMEDKNHSENPDSDAYQQKIRALEAQIQEISAERDQVSQESSATIQDLTQQLSMRDTSIEKQDHQIREQGAAFQRLQESLVEMQQQHKQLEAITNGREESTLQPQPMMVTKWHAPQEDRAVRDKLSKLVDRVRAWARNYSLVLYSNLDGVPTSDKDLAMGSLDGYCIYDNWDMTIKKMPIGRDKIPAVLVQAILAKDVFERFFIDPFFALMSIEGDEYVPRPEGMRTIQHAMAEAAGQAEGHLWRSQTVRGLSNTADSFLLARAEKSCIGFASSFLSGPVGILLQPSTEPTESNLHDKRLQELQTLYKEAAQLALTLWSQRAHMTCQKLQDLPRFTVTSEMMSAHRLHHLDEDDTSLDGTSVLLVVQPAILAFGSEDAEHYDQHKVWAPATVLLERE